LASQTAGRVALRIRPAQVHSALRMQPARVLARATSAGVRPGGGRGGESKGVGRFVDQQPCMAQRNLGGTLGYAAPALYVLQLHCYVQKLLIDRLSTAGMHAGVLHSRA